MDSKSLDNQHPAAGERTVGWIHRLLQIGQAAADQPAAELYERMLAHIATGLFARTGWLALRCDGDGDEFEIVASIGLSANTRGKPIRLSSEQVAQAATTGEALAVNTGPQDFQITLGGPECDCGLSFCTFKCWPLIGSHGLIGLLNVGHVEADCDSQRWQPEELRSLMSVISMVVHAALLSHCQARRLEEEHRVSQTLHQSIEELMCAKGALEAAQRQLLQQEKMASIGQLAAGVAHEINNPVGYINANLNSLRHYLRDLDRLLDLYIAQEPALDEARRAAIAELKQGIGLDEIRQDLRDLLDETSEGLQRVRSIVKDLKDFAHPDEGEWVAADLHRSLDTTLNVANNEIKYKAEVVREYGDIPPVECLPFQINQVFLNLLVNAAHAIEERGTITLRTRRHGGEVCIEISDSGRGIAPEHLTQIFDPFFTTKAPGKGTGLGLAVSYGIVEKHGGRIEADSQPGRGTTFRVWLPIVQATDAG